MFVNMRAAITLCGVRPEGGRGGLTTRRGVPPAIEIGRDLSQKRQVLFFFCVSQEKRPI